MSPATSAPSDHGWAALLSSRLVAGGRPDGGGWQTAAELAPVFRVGLRTVRPKLAALVAAGALEQVAGKNAGGQACTFFRPMVRSAQHSAKLKRAR